MAGKKDEKQETNERGVPAIHWNDEHMQTGYANICNVAGTREEVSLFFGTNESWQAGKKPVEVRLDHRILITPCLLMLEPAPAVRIVGTLSDSQRVRSILCLSGEK